MNTQPLTTEEKQGIVMSTLLENEFNKPGYALFGIEKEVIMPLVKKGWIHKDTYKYTGGATLTNAGRTMLQEKLTNI